MQTLQKLLDSKAMGEITDAEIHYDLDLPSWMSGMTDPGYKPGDGLNFGIGCHSLDQALHLFGKPKSVTSFYRSLRGVKSETEDSFHMILQYKDKPLIVHVKTHAVTKMRQPLKYLIRGNSGTYIKFGDDQQEHQIFAGKKPGDAGFGEEPAEIWGELQTVEKVHETQEKVGEYWVGKVKPENKGIWQYYEDVYRAVRGEIEPVIKSETSLWGIRVIELARESATKGVTVPFDL
jgi:predicted dehydrogenase